MNKWKIATVVLSIVLCLLLFAGCSGITDADLDAAYDRGYSKGYDDGFDEGYLECRCDFLPRLERLCNSIGDPDILVQDYNNGLFTIYDVAYFLEFVKEELWDMCA